MTFSDVVHLITFFIDFASIFDSFSLNIATKNQSKIDKNRSKNWPKK